MSKKQCSPYNAIRLVATDSARRYQRVHSINYQAPLTQTSTSRPTSPKRSELKTASPTKVKTTHTGETADVRGEQKRRDSPRSSSSRRESDEVPQPQVWTDESLLDAVNRLTARTDGQTRRPVSTDRKRKTSDPASPLTIASSPLTRRGSSGAMRGEAGTVVHVDTVKDDADAEVVNAAWTRIFAKGSGSTRGEHQKAKRKSPSGGRRSSSSTPLPAADAAFILGLGQFASSHYLPTPAPAEHLDRQQGRGVVTSPRLLNEGIGFATRPSRPHHSPLHVGFHSPPEAPKGYRGQHQEESPGQPEPSLSAIRTTRGGVDDSTGIHSVVSVPTSHSPLGPQPPPTKQAPPPPPPTKQASPATTAASSKAGGRIYNLTDSALCTVRTTTDELLHLLFLPNTEFFTVQCLSVLNEEQRRPKHKCHG